MGNVYTLDRFRRAAVIPSRPPKRVPVIALTELHGKISTALDAIQDQKSVLEGYDERHIQEAKIILKNLGAHIYAFNPTNSQPLVVLQKTIDEKNTASGSQSGRSPAYLSDVYVKLAILAQQIQHSGAGRAPSCFTQPGLA
jgi:hypothetical protein